ncbi:hypothetical protein FOL47_005770 [Perkinsus chesapeaki]|uniref:Peptidase A1 domain-containing protein n=1 Tax=Perkinsus chesapeaki TaxID=330153 RepID=A0A7J6LX56_PERCH|nr:hypothetical protein FOL47_005770 [Perkinsus chesapeaki]
MKPSAGQKQLSALWLLCLGSIDGTLLRLPISQTFITWENIFTVSMIVPIRADNQTLNLMMDTGTDTTFLLSNQSRCDGKPCGGSVFGCYQCELAVCDRESTEVVFGDDSSTSIVHHKGELELGGVRVSDVDFGIVKDYSTNGLPPHASLGLRLRSEDIDEDNDSDFVPILDQLVDKGIITGKKFSIYFEPKNMDEGELIIGGEDTTRYQEPLAHVPLTVGTNAWSVDLRRVEVAGQHINLPYTSYSAEIDSGATSLYAPREVTGPILEAINASLNAAGRYMLSRPSGYHELQSCSDRDYLPAINLALRGESDDAVNVTILKDLYVLEWPGGGRCSILIVELPGMFVVGLGLLRQYYLHYQAEKRQIGIALTKAKPTFRRLRRRVRKSQPSKVRTFPDA